MRPRPECLGMAAPQAKKDNEKDARLEMLKELAKLTKPTGKSAQGKSEEKDDEE